MTMLFIGSHATRTCSGDSQRGIFISPRYQLMTGIIYPGKRQFKRAIPACHGQKPWARHGQRKLAATTCHKEVVPTGQTAVQAPHSTHVSLISAFCSTIKIASTGQTAIHCPQPIQLSFSTCAFKKTTPYLLIFLMGSARILMLMFLTNNIIRNQISL